MKIVYACDNCGESFDLEEDCVEHEIGCKTFFHKECFKCGKTEEIEAKDDYETEHLLEGWHLLDLGRQGYGSNLDGCDVDFELCDECLIMFVKSFPIEYQEKIFNSGSNAWGSQEEWIEINK